MKNLKKMKKAMDNIIFSFFFFSAHSGNSKGFGNKTPPAPPAPTTSTTSSPSSAGKGKHIACQLKPSRAGSFRRLEGSYARLLAKHCELYESIRRLPQQAMNDQYHLVDLYARLSESNTCWFIGKVLYPIGVPPCDALTAIDLLLLEYAKTLRPQELAGYPSLGKELQLWYAPGNTEMQVAQNKIPLLRVITNPLHSVNYDKVGYEPEIYQDKEEGFRCERDEDGQCLSPAFDIDQRFVDNTR
eukprot:gene5955-6557_t